jgi:hypothetical protein
MILTMRTWIATLLLVAACGGSPKSAAPTMPQASGATCDQMGAHLAQIIPASETEKGKKVTTVLQERCTVDAWSAQARQCLFDVKDIKEADACKQYLSGAQVDATNTALNTAMPPGKKEPAVEGDVMVQPPAPLPPPPPAKATKRSPEKKPQPKAGKTGDPCEGGE